MKKIFALIIAAIACIGANAQAYQGETAIGINLLYGSYTESLGIGGRFQYVPYDQIRAVAEFDYFTGHSGKNLCDININAEYLLAIKSDQLYLYPLAGLNYTMSSHKVDNGSKVESNHIGLNLGAGLEYKVNEHIGVSAEYRHTIIRDVDQGVFAVGVNYKF